MEQGFEYSRRREFSMMLKNLVAASGKTQKEICKDLGIPLSSFNSWIQLRAFPRDSYVKKLESYFGVDFRTLHLEFMANCFELSDLLERNVVTINGYELNARDKKKLYKLAELMFME